MPCCDRTAEFRTIGKSFQMKLQAHEFPQKKNVNVLVQQSSMFNQYAKKIGTDLSSTFAKLEKLALLAKRKSLFDDRMPEIDELTHMIKQDIASLNIQIAQLQEFLSQRQNSLDKSKKHHSTSIIVGLQSKLASMSNEFKQVLELRTENLKQQRTRREKFGNSQPIPSSLPQSASTGHMGSVLLLEEENKSKESNGNVVLDMDQLRKRNVQQQISLIDEQDSYIKSRAEAMENIESTVVELGQIFSQLAHMVQEQGEMVGRIDSHVDEANLNVEAAHIELLKYFQSITNNRWLALKVFGVLIVFFIIFIVFLV